MGFIESAHIIWMYILKVQSQRDELLSALDELLADTQHIEHLCHDENCPVIRAKMLSKNIREERRKDFTP